MISEFSKKLEFIQGTPNKNIPEDGGDSEVLVIQQVLGQKGYAKEKVESYLSAYKELRKTETKNGIFRWDNLGEVIVTDKKGIPSSPWSGYIVKNMGITMANAPYTVLDHIQEFKSMKEIPKVAKKLVHAGPYTAIALGTTLYIDWEKYKGGDLVIAIVIDASATAATYGVGVVAGAVVGRATVNPVVAGVVTVSASTALSTIIDKKADEWKEEHLERSKTP